MVVETNHPVTGPFRTMGVTVNAPSDTPGVHPDARRAVGLASIPTISVDVLWMHTYNAVTQSWRFPSRVWEVVVGMNHDVKPASDGEGAAFPSTQALHDAHSFRRDLRGRQRLGRRFRPHARGAWLQGDRHL